MVIGIVALAKNFLVFFVRPIGIMQTMRTVECFSSTDFHFLNLELVNLEVRIRNIEVRI
jgi:hypothetical protein